MKMIKITLFVMMLTLMTSGMALALTGTATGPTALTVTSTFTGTPVFTVTPSNQVWMDYNGVAQSYGILSEHLNGSRSFGGGSGDSSIYYKAKTAGTNPTATAVSSAFSTTGWSAL